MPKMAHRLNAVSADFSSKDHPEPVPPEPHCLMCDVDAALMKEVFDVAQRQYLADNHHHSEADDLGRGLEVAEDVRVTHPVRLAAGHAPGKPIFL